MSGLPKMLILAGILLIVAGCVAFLFDWINLPLGHLPGDFSWHRRGWTLSFPLATCVLVSALLSLLFWVANLLRR
jgi:hypothetical protein